MNLPISLYVALRYWRAKSADRFGRLVANLASFGIVLGVMALIIVLSVAKAVVHNRLSTEGVFVAGLEKEISFYKTQNAILSEEFLTSSSLTNILAKAEGLGFTNRSQSLLVLKTSRPLAVKQLP